MNDLYTPQKKTWFKFLITLVGIFLFISIEVMVIIGLFYMMLYLE